MRKTKIVLLGIIAIAMSNTAQASVIWANWKVKHLDSVTGSISSFNISYSGLVAPETQVGIGTNYWNPGAPYLSATVPNAPTAYDIVALYWGDMNTITFAQPVTNPVMAIVGLGNASIPISNTFDRPFDIISFGPGYWGGPGTLLELPGNVLQGFEGHGVIQFQGTFTSISWTVSDYQEPWHGFTVGLIPEPSTLSLFILSAPIALIRHRRCGRKS